MNQQYQAMQQQAPHLLSCHAIASMWELDDALYPPMPRDDGDTESVNPEEAYLSECTDNDVRTRSSQRIKRRRSSVSGSTESPTMSAAVAYSTGLSFALKASNDQQPMVPTLPTAPTRRTNGQQPQSGPGKEICTHPNCEKMVVVGDSGTLDKCKAHGGGSRCTHPGAASHQT
jgi:hypothetical protein